MVPYAQSGLFSTGLARMSTPPDNPFIPRSGRIRSAGSGRRAKTYLTRMTKALSSAGDTVRWVLGDTVSGTGTDAQAHILIKPTQAGLKTNLIITTSLRAYHLELRAFEETYMAAVSWRYADQQLVTRVARSGAVSASASPAGLQLDRLKFRYDMDGDFPHWRPDRVFDDGRKVYIQFPARLDQGEAPALFVIGRDGKSQLVNYRMSGDYYVVDRLFARAELRLGEKRQDVVRIARNDLGSAQP
ncbi:P-type conjugative transfer protein TrbG [Henriciella mobilis]|nr:P-type conjugative transfer protein TrbG [Henriciella mobilis]RIJ22784.1 P-type conjugative transfer protein TrbG [Henriciella mobilis]